MARRNPQLLKRFGRALRARRLDLKMSQEALAEASELSNAYISQLERGLKSPSLLALVDLAGALKISVSELVRDVEG